MKIIFHSANKSIIKCLLIYMGKLDNKQQQLLQIKRFMKKGTFNKQKVIILIIYQQLTLLLTKAKYCTYLVIGSTISFHWNTPFSAILDQDHHLKMKDMMILKNALIPNNTI